VRESGSHVGGCLANISPVAAIGNNKAVNLREVDGVNVAEEFGCFGSLLVPHVADPLEEQQRQDVRLPVRTIHGTPAQDLGAVPKVRLEFVQGHGHSTLILKNRGTNRAPSRHEHEPPARRVARRAHGWLTVREHVSPLSHTGCVMRRRRPRSPLE
jgi:hypothetical protein